MDEEGKRQRARRSDASAGCTSTGKPEYKLRDGSLETRKGSVSRVP